MTFLVVEPFLNGVRVTLPFADQTTSDSMIVDTKLQHRHSYVIADTMRILVVDDDPILREFACVYLSTPTASVETASDGKEALARLRSEPFDFVLTDLDMPVMGGLELISTIRADPSLSSLPIIVATSNEDVVSIDLAYEAGASSFVTKPINWRLLSYQVRFVFRTSRQTLD